MNLSTVPCCVDGPLSYPSFKVTGAALLRDDIGGLLNVAFIQPSKHNLEHFIEFVFQFQIKPILCWNRKCSINQCLGKSFWHRLILGCNSSGCDAGRNFSDIGGYIDSFGLAGGNLHGLLYSFGLACWIVNGHTHRLCSARWE